MDEAVRGDEEGEQGPNVAKNEQRKDRTTREVCEWSVSVMSIYGRIRPETAIFE